MKLAPQATSTVLAVCMCVCACVRVLWERKNACVCVRGRKRWLCANCCSRSWQCTRTKTSTSKHTPKLPHTNTHTLAGGAAGGGGFCHRVNDDVVNRRRCSIGHGYPELALWRKLYKHRAHMYAYVYLHASLYIWIRKKIIYAYNNMYIYMHIQIWIYT